MAFALMLVDLLLGRPSGVDHVPQLARFRTLLMRVTRSKLLGLPRFWRLINIHVLAGSCFVARHVSFDVSRRQEVTIPSMRLLSW